MEQPNLSYIKNMSGGDLAFEQKLIGIIKTEFPQEKAVYFSNLQAANYKLAADNVHKLKHKISILGLEKCYNIAVHHEEQLLSGSTGSSADFEAILKMITDYLKTL